jgi:p-hydroxybenzoate 3-monooxygenase
MGERPDTQGHHSETALRRVWRRTHFSSSMTTMPDTSGEPYDEQLQQS